jgi:molybdopterin-guanine dinucleotide biosynthesis protein A
VKIVGVLLAGGQSRRMGGGDKALRVISGISLLDRVIERLRPQVEMLVLNANGDPARFARFGLPVVPDSVAGYAGPLAGVLAGLDWAAEHQPDCTHVVSAATDAPFLREDLRHAVVDEVVRKVDVWTARYRLATVLFRDEPVDPFFNANRPEDLATAAALLARETGAQPANETP